MRAAVPNFVHKFVAQNLPRDYEQGMSPDQKREFTAYLIARALRVFDTALQNAMEPTPESKTLPREPLPEPGQQFDLPSNMPEGIAAKLLREKLAALKPLRTKAAFDSIETEKKFFIETANILTHNSSCS